ncbi:class IV adenylate cyclase [Symmachiella dynata]|uniref:class IV adenylate cyclase n=1 Tax=Symmachiella dynata TaxID=2527995 RepID=UPI0030EDB78F
MSYEVELKFPVADPQGPLSKLLELGAVKQRTIQQRDTYFAHPQRSFAESNEALRIRQVGDENRITYKGPIIDQETKMRREIELPFQTGAVAGQSLRELLEILGFTPVHSVVKTRETYALTWQDRDCEICVDHIEALGTFMEVETLAEEAALGDAKETILKLAAQLGLSAPERRSYLTMLLEQKGIPRE